ncbi:AMP-binding protein, partial [Abyssibius alkaniclasticus]
MQNHISTMADVRAVEAEKTYAERVGERTLFEQITSTEAAHGARPAVTFQLRSGPKEPAETLNWTQLKARVAQTANLFRSLGVGEKDVVAYILPNCNEAVLSFLGGATAGIVNPINP